ncbi:hypothetical protein HMPREF9123_2322 [Neisseria bacilliformis ATCC BAA-1200]|uniref:Uncharacterized protein n=1 Tax=Neisseria bacilliformis ATCC BAA-1200 TaxID=888742 RepID=F2BF15_9NEIS|nr:hypothetical protein HMPREF9123_2322 [Neisseria bacilliformis ATCC BAA-1200]
MGGKNRVRGLRRICASFTCLNAQTACLTGRCRRLLPCKQFPIR